MAMDFRKALRGCLVRAAFVFHGLAGIFTLVYITQEPLYFLIGVGVILFMVEMLTTIRCNDKGEWRWFIPVVVIYISLAAPVIWITELDLLRIRLLQNFTEGHCPTTLVSLEETENINMSRLGGTIGRVSQSTLDSYNFGEIFSTLFQQSFMLILILGRWFMPKGGMTRDELSLLLLVYIAMAADMLEFSIETLRLGEIACHRPIFIAILAIWTWSLIQFSFGQSMSYNRTRTTIHGVLNREEGDTGPSTRSSCSAYVCGSEIWALLTDVILQDGPYLVIRMYVIIRYRVTEHILIFFAVKNFLQVVMQIYRFVVLIRDTREQEKRQEELLETFELSDRFTMGQLSGEPSSEPVNDGSIVHETV